MRSIQLALLSIGTLASFSAQAAALSTAQVRSSVSAYATKLGIRPSAIAVRVLGNAGKTTHAVVNVAGKQTEIAVQHDRVTPNDALTNALVAAHVPLKRAGLGKTSTFAARVLTYQPGVGAQLGTNQPENVLGTPRAGQLATTVALDAVSLGHQGSISVGLNQPITSGRIGAGVIVRENGIGSGATIINQTPGLVEVSDGARWYRVGYAGYKTAGDFLPLSQAIDPIPSGKTLSSVRVTDDPSAPHPHGFDPTDNAVAAARGVGGFDLVSVQAVNGIKVPTTLAH